MLLIEKLEAKRHEIDRLCHEGMNDRDYLWFCDLRDLLDETITTARTPFVVTGEISDELYAQLTRPGYVVHRSD